MEPTTTNIPTDFIIEIVNWNNEDERDACLAMRDQVFVLEQKVPREDEHDEFDPTSRHILARDTARNPIGTGRVTPRAIIGRMAVVPDWRGKQVGAAILNALLEQARALAYPAVELHAQTRAVPFYEKFGFAAYGDEFLECDIKHFHMRLQLAPNAKPERPALPPRPEVRSVTIESMAQAATEALSLIVAAKRELCIYTRDLDPALLDTQPMLEALKRLAIGGRGTSIRIVVQEPEKPARNGHRLIALAQRLTSVFAFRTPVQETDLQYPSAFLLNDTRGYYFRVLGNRYEGDVVNYAPGKHAQLLEYFNQVWERSEGSDELRQLAL